MGERGWPSREEGWSVGVHQVVGGMGGFAYRKTLRETE